MFALDHLAFPCFDVPATVRFYTEILGGTLRHAQSGPAEAWNAREYLLLAFELPGGVVLDFFSFDGIQRPAAGALPKDIGHVALSVGTRQEVHSWRDRFEGAGVPFWVETHEEEDVHVYASDPNGVTLELLAAQDGARPRMRGDRGEVGAVGAVGVVGEGGKSDAARAVLERWMAMRGAAQGE